MMNEQVVKAVTEIAQGFKVNVKAQFLARYQFAIDDWSKKSQATGMTSPHNIYPTNGNMSRLEYRSNAFRQGQISRFLDTSRRTWDEQHAIPNLTPWQYSCEQLRYFLKADAQAIAERKAEQEAEDAIQGFIRKMSAKLQGILDAKGDFEQVEVNGYLGRNTLHFTFVDGSAFTVVNDIIIKASCLGKVHNQYPTRFTNVVLRGMGGGLGGGMKGISEAWMKRNFKQDQVIHLGPYKAPEAAPLTPRQQARADLKNTKEQATADYLSSEAHALRSQGL